MTATAKKTEQKAPVKLVRHTLGYLEVQPKPTPEELATFYNDLYYGGEDGSNDYTHGYTEEELEHKYLAAEEAAQFALPTPGSLYEVGFGEGFMLNYFHQKGWKVSGTDFTADGLEAFFPALKDKVQLGDIYAMLDAEIASGRQHDLVICNNVLEHVIDPIGLLKRMQSILKPGGVCRISVPNDGSWLQDAVVEKGLATPQFWECAPAHLNYFTVDSLRAIFEHTGWKVKDMLAGFPIDMFLLNPDSCYTQDKAKGRNCHFARLAFEMALWKQGIDKIIAFRRGNAAAGVGRDLIAYVTM